MPSIRRSQVRGEGVKWGFEEGKKQINHLSQGNGCNETLELASCKSRYVEEMWGCWQRGLRLRFGPSEEGLSAMPGLRTRRRTHYLSCHPHRHSLQALQPSSGHQQPVVPSLRDPYIETGNGQIFLQHYVTRSPVFASPPSTDEWCK